MRPFASIATPTIGVEVFTRGKVAEHVCHQFDIEGGARLGSLAPRYRRARAACRNKLHYGSHAAFSTGPRIGAITSGALSSSWWMGAVALAAQAPSPEKQRSAL
jgi:hypothetical protein